MEKVLFVSLNGQIQVAKRDQPLSARGDSRREGDMSVYASNKIYNIVNNPIGQQRVHEMGYGTFVDLTSASHRYDPDGPNGEQMRPIDLGRYFRALTILHESRKANPENYLGCPEQFGALLLAGEGNVGLRLNDFETFLMESYNRAAFMLAGVQVVKDNRFTPEYKNGEIPRRGIELLGEIVQMKLPSLDQAILSCAELSIPVNFSALQREIERSKLEITAIAPI